MIKQLGQPAYGSTFESSRRLRPRLWDVDYCLLRGLAGAVRSFAEKYVTPDAQIVDYGCGAKPYRSLFPTSVKYVGVDTCASAYVDIMVAHGRPLPLPDGSADHIISTQVVYLIPDYKAYLDECHRVLGPEGFLFITSHGTWTYHPASGGDYYRFTQDGLRHILDQAGFQVVEIEPIVGTLGTGLHLRQLVLSAYLKKMHFSWLANGMNFLTNLRILVEDRLSPRGMRMSSPVIFAVVARRKS